MSDLASPPDAAPPALQPPAAGAAPAPRHYADRQALAMAARARLGLAQPKAPPPKALHALGTEAVLQLAATRRPALLAPVLPERGLMLVHGPRGVGCSHVLVGCAASLITAGNFLGWWAPRAVRLLFISGTASSASLSARLRAALPAAQGRKPAGDRLTLLTPEQQAGPMPALDTREGLIELAPYLAAADMVVIDDAAVLVPGMNRNAARSQAQLAEFLRILHHAGKTVLVAQHSGEGVRGRADRGVLACLEAHADVVIGLRQPKDYDVAQGARFELNIERSRHLPGKARQGREICLDAGSDGGLRWNAANAADSVKARFMALIGEGLPAHEAGRALGLPKVTAWRWARRAASAATAAQSSAHTGASSPSPVEARRDSGAQTQVVDTIMRIAA